MVKVCYAVLTGSVAVVYVFDRHGTGTQPNNKISPVCRCAWNFIRVNTILNTRNEDTIQVISLDVVCERITRVIWILEAIVVGVISSWNSNKSIIFEMCVCVCECSVSLESSQ